MSVDDLALIEPHLERIDLPARQILEHPNKPIKHVYFLESGLASIVACNAQRHEVEAAVIGREGMSGATVIMGDDRSANCTYIRIAGQGMRIKVTALRRVMEQSVGMHGRFLRFVETAIVQAAQTALANGRGNLEERLVRWILMAHDRLDGNDLPLTHEFLSLMLGVRRAGVTVALNVLVDGGAISMRRGVVSVRNRRGLERASGGHYGVPEAEYERLMGWKHGRAA